MDISIGRLTITNFCNDNIEHLKFKKDMLDDGLMCYFFKYLNEDNFLTPSVIDEQIKIRNFYLVKDIDKLIGWIYIGGFEKQIVLDISIHPNYRKQGYLTMILEEFRDYLFQNDIANEIEVMIKNNNTGALKAVKKVKYKYLGKIGSYYNYNSTRD